MTDAQKGVLSILLFFAVFLIGGVIGVGDSVNLLEECQKNLPRNEFCELKAVPKQKNMEEK